MNEHTRHHTLAYLAALASSAAIIKYGGAPEAVLACLVLMGLTVNLELWLLSTRSSFDPNPIGLSIINLVYSLLTYTGLGRDYILLLAVSLITILSAVSYWEALEYNTAYTFLLPVATFTAPIAGLAVGSAHPFFLTLISLLETHLVYSIESWEGDPTSRIGVHVMAAGALYGLVYGVLGDPAVTLLLTATYFIKYIAYNTGKLRGLYPGIDVYVKPILEGVMA